MIGYTHECARMLDPGQRLRHLSQFAILVADNTRN